MNILITGTTGLIGSALVRSFTDAGHDVAHLVRTLPLAEANAIAWNPAAGELDRKALEGRDAVIHLSGENIMEGRWSHDKKVRMRSSRIDTTQLLATAMAAIEQPPSVWLCASAIGYYGDRGDTVMCEDGAPGAGFLADMCRDWEAAVGPAVEKGIRVVNIRIGVVLSRGGGALAEMLMPFRMGVGGPAGTGRQFISWIHMDDVAGAISHLLADTSATGPVNIVGPNPVTNAEFARALAAVLSRPAVVRTPAIVLRMLFGAVADETILSSTRVEPAHLLKSGYAFQYPVLENALRQLLG